MLVWYASTTGNNNLGFEQTNTKANVKTNPNRASEPTGLGNTTTRALTNAQKNTGNNIRIDNSSQLQNPALSTQMAKMSAITVQALLSPLQAFPTNAFVNNRAFYDISFKAATTSTIRQVLLTFPAGTAVSQAAVVEVSGIGDGTFSTSGQTVTYTVTSPSQVLQGKTIRLQVDYILNPPTPSPAGGYTIQVTTKDPGGATIDSGSTSGYVIKQIQEQDIANNAIFSAKIQDGQVLTKDIADNAITKSKLAIGAVTPAVVVQSSNYMTINPGTSLIVAASCNSGEVATGGGYQISQQFPGFEKVVVHTNINLGGQWTVVARNTDINQGHQIKAEASCLHLSP